MSKMAILSCSLVLAGSQVAAAPRQPAAVDETAVRMSLEYARARENSPFDLYVFCTDKQARRALRVYPNGVAVWNHRLQVTLPWSLRDRLLGLLLKNNFPGFERRYGDAGDSDLMDGALRVSCRVSLRINGLSKVSEQLYDGPQKGSLRHLANGLLDSVQPLAAQGLGSSGLADGLRKLAAGKLDPQLLTLRYVVLPVQDGQPGSIVRVRDGRLSRQSYTPGQNIGSARESPLPACRFRPLLAAIEAANIPGLPLNLWSDQRIELEIRVLANRKTIVARPFTRLRADRAGPAQRRFDVLLGQLDGLGNDADTDCSKEN